MITTPAAWVEVDVYKRQRYGQRPRRAYNAVIRVLGQSQIIAIGIVISRGGLIAGGYQYVDARLLRPGIDATVGEISVHLLAGIVVVFGKASGRAQGEVCLLYTSRCV